MGLSIILYFSLFVFWAGALGLVFYKRNIITLLLYGEILLTSVNLYSFVSSLILQENFGQIYGLIILTVAAAESAIGLSLFISFFWLKRSSSFQGIKLLID